MQRELERELKKYPSRIIEHTTLSQILSNLGYNRINDKIVQLKNKGILTALKSGLYLYNPVYDEALVSKEIIANLLLGPSYISFDYALWYHGLIPESVQTIQSATTKRSKSYSTPLGVFSYKQVKKELYNIALEIHNTKVGNFIIASKEKALCDKVYYTKDIPIRSKSAMFAFLEDDLRIDLDELSQSDMKVFGEYYKVTKSKKIALLQKIIEELQL
jgi:predicted transcriptional regulator of viral defense system